ncbi:TonB-dependent receptor [Brevundimonas sp.]|uniref:TonB-dependent receptor n=1 Tax=Brevundimonas sp. TaxID=1871086 RepID=UPI001A31A51B|nr:TonB-dependent receptor [Brevundimonas sp.]MBJ7486210.1 TonB-dependent receptor [Brevundimonas sp.]
MRKITHTAGLRLASVSAIALLMGAGAVHAQTQPDPDEDATAVDEIVVTGFRASLAAALNIKRREAGVVDAISAEDIADFPDTNLAESIQRIPGVSIDRDAGEGRSITVRGLGSDFTRTRINGIEAQATTSATDSSGGANRGRGFDFNVFASELFNNITVRKTASAEVEEGSLGATVDLRTSRPFDYQGFTAAASVQGGYNDLSQSWSPRYAFLASNTFFDGQLGALASYAFSKKDSIEEGFSSVRWGPANGDGGFSNPAALPGGATSAGVVYHPRIPRYGRLTHEQERTGATLSLQFRPSNGKTLMTFDSLYSNLDSTRRENFLEAWSFSRAASAGGKPEVDILETVVDPTTGEMVYARFNDVDMRTENRFDVLETEYSQNTFALEQEFTDNFRFSGTIGRSKSEFANPLQVNAIIDRQNTAGYSWDFRENRNLPLINYGFNVADPNAWSITGPTGLLKSELRLTTSYQTNIYETGEGAFEWNVTDVLTLKAGASRKKYSSNGTGYSRNLGNNDAPALPAGTTMASVTQLLTGFGRNFDLPAGSATSWIIPDLEALRNIYKWDCNCNTGVPGGDFRLLGLDNTAAFANFREITETDTGYWVQAEWDTTLLGIPFRGNVGVRQVKTELEALGFSNIGNVAVPTPGSNEYDDTLPSLNVAIEPVENLQIRFAASKVMARPPITNLVPVYTLSALNAPNPSASLGNVALEPYRAKTYDLSIEWYFAPESLLSFAYFYKDISTFVQTTATTLTYAQLTAIDPVAFPVGARTATLNHVFTTQANTEGGPLKGFEISYQQPFRFLPGFLSNLGTQLNYTHVESQIDYCVTSACAAFVTADLVNLSPNAWNATLYYDDGKLNARVSAAYRDDYFQQVPAPNNGTGLIAVNGKSETTSIDASASYALTDNVTVTVEGINLTDEPNRQYHGDLGAARNSTYVYHHTGRQVFIGARYKF